MVMQYPVELWLWPSPEGKERQLAPTTRRCSAGCLKYRQRALEECGVISNTTPYHNTWRRTSVAAAVQHPFSTVSPDSNPTIVVLQTDA
ncbi:hypothetical protein TNCV_853921 [Trichonephila clavipes]|nr:hypothetical protein TNCV_853921 [Trichonephila clavipes]